MELEIDASVRSGGTSIEGASPVPIRRVPRGVRRAIAATYLCTSAGYLCWRAGFTLVAEDAVFSAVFFASEAAAVLVFLLFVLCIVRGPVSRDRPRLRAEDEIEADVFVLTCNEPVALVRQTLTAARDMVGNHRVWLCDDGDRQEMNALAQAVGVGYLRRGENTDYKAGNINHALANTQARFVVVLDADHVVSRDFLRQTIPYLVLTITLFRSFFLGVFRHGIG